MNYKVITVLTVGLVLVSTGLAWGNTNNQLLNNKTNKIVSTQTTSDKSPAIELNSDTVTIPKTNDESQQFVASNEIDLEERDCDIPPPIPGAMGEAKYIEKPLNNTQIPIDNISTGILYNDLNFGNNGNFKIGINTINDFKTIYDNYYRYSNGATTYFGDDTSNSYGTFSIGVKTDSNNVVNEISVSQFAPNGLSNQFITSKGLKLGDTVSTMYQLYGGNCSTTVVTNPNNKLATFVYHYMNGTITYYAQYNDSSIENATIYSMTISLDYFMPED